jgi:uncharacterized Zn-finger protein
VVEFADKNRPSSSPLADEDVTKCDVFSESLNGKQTEKSKYIDSERKCAKYSTTQKAQVHTHAREKPFRCEMCGKCYLCRSHLLTHNHIHKVEKVLRCDICGTSSKEAGELVAHNHICTGDKSFKCEICVKGFAANGTLVTHRRIHTGEKPFVCEMCGKAFAVSSSLVQHQRTHTGERPFRCDVCNKAFACSGHLVNCHCIHTRDKPFICSICNKGVAESGPLVKHHRLHIGERPCTCDICGKGFGVVAVWSVIRERILGRNRFHVIYGINLFHGVDISLHVCVHIVVTRLLYVIFVPNDAQNLACLSNACVSIAKRNHSSVI